MNKQVYYKNENKDQTAGFRPIRTTLRRGAISVQGPSEYRRLKPHRNEKERLLQYKEEKG